MEKAMIYGCFNRPPLRTSHAAQDGWYQDGHTRTPRMVPVPHLMTVECQYSRDDRYADPGCIGYTHKQTPHYPDSHTGRAQG